MVKGTFCVMSARRKLLKRRRKREMDNIIYKNKKEVYNIVDIWAKKNRFDYDSYKQEIQELKDMLVKEKTK